MHEIALCKSLVSILNRETASSEIGDVKIIYLEIGKLRYIIPDIFISAFKSIPKNKKLEKAKIDFSIMPVKVKCCVCAAESELTEYDFKCKKCSSTNVDIISGNEFKISRIEW